MKIKEKSQLGLVSVLIPVSERNDDLAGLYADYHQALTDSGINFETVFVLDGPFAKEREKLEKLQADGQDITIVQLGKMFGEAASLEAGLPTCRGEWILTLPAYFQVESSEIPNLFEEPRHADMLVGRRNPRTDSRINQRLSKGFHAVVNWMTDSCFHDLGSGVRFFHRSLLEDIALYGDQHRFLPILASRRGYKVEEVDLRQSKQENFRRLPRFGIYPRRLLDLVTVFFLVKFTKKPLRFFGLIGAGLSATGALWTVYLVAQRVFMDQALTQRPALLLASLLIVLGVQVFALGLIGEIVIFAHAKDIREFSIEEIVNPHDPG